MAYKKYIKRGGKVYGPYIYHSKRVGGKVVSEYRGSHNKKSNHKKFLWIGLGVLVAVLLVFAIYSLGNRISGQATFDVKVDYKEGEPIDGILQLSLKEGELLPSSSKLVLENNGQKYEYPLEEVLSEDVEEGGFYIEEKSVSGSGKGYGIKGTKEVFPTVYFTLEIYSKQETEKKPTKTEESEEAINESPKNESPKDNTEQVEEQAEESEESAITGQTVSLFFGWMGTGRVVMELQKQVDGQVSADQPFSYTLKKGEEVEIKLKSVKTNSENLKDNDIDLKVEGNEVIVTTDYSKEEEGFGKEYLGENVEKVKIDLSDLDLVLASGDLKLSLMYAEEELVSLTTTLQDGQTTDVQIDKVSEQQIKEAEEVSEEEAISISESGLTEEERAILINEFGSINIKTIRQVNKSNRLIIGSQLRDYKIEHSYEYPQAKEALKLQIHRDRVKWLKDIANTLSKKASASHKVDIIEDSYDL